MPGILLHALVGIDADGAGIGEPEGAARPHPFLDQVERQRLAQPQPHHLVEPGLPDAKRQQHAGDADEQFELMEEGRKVFALHRVVERPVPAVEHNLHQRGRDDHRNGDGGHPKNLAAQRRTVETRQHGADLAAQRNRCGGSGGAAGGAPRLIRPYRHSYPAPPPNDDVPSPGGQRLEVEPMPVAPPCVACAPVRRRLPAHKATDADAGTETNCNLAARIGRFGATNCGYRRRIR